MFEKIVEGRMSTQLLLADALKLRDEGVARVEYAHSEFMSRIREIAIQICRQQGTVSSDELRQWCDDSGIKAPDPHVFGALFRTGWVKVGYKQSTYPSNRGRTICVWRVREA